MENEPARPLRLYVWEGVLCDYTCGMIVALAPDLPTARRLVRSRAARGGGCFTDDIEDALKGRPQVCRRPTARYVRGGG